MLDLDACEGTSYAVSPAAPFQKRRWIDIRSRGVLVLLDASERCLWVFMERAQVLELARLMEYQGMAMAAPPALLASRWDRAQPGRVPGDAAVPDPASATRDSAEPDTHPVRPGRLPVLLHSCRPVWVLLRPLPESCNVLHPCVPPALWHCIASGEGYRSEGLLNCRGAELW